MKALANCEECGKQFQRHRGGRRQKFCSRRCMYKKNNRISGARQREVLERRRAERRCVVCGAATPPQHLGSPRKYCSRQCRQWAVAIFAKARHRVELTEQEARVLTFKGHHGYSLELRRDIASSVMAAARLVTAVDANPGTDRPSLADLAEGWARLRQIVYAASGRHGKEEAPM